MESSGNERTRTVTTHSRSSRRRSGFDLYGYVVRGQAIRTFGTFFQDLDTKPRCHQKLFAFPSARRLQPAVVIDLDEADFAAFCEKNCLPKSDLALPPSWGITVFDLEHKTQVVRYLAALVHQLHTRADSRKTSVADLLAGAEQQVWVWALATN